MGGGVCGSTAFSVSGLPRRYFFPGQALVYINLLIYIERTMAELLVKLISIMLKQPEMLEI